MAFGYWEAVACGEAVFIAVEDSGGVDFAEGAVGGQGVCLDRFSAVLFDWIPGSAYADPE